MRNICFAEKNMYICIPQWFAPRVLSQGRLPGFYPGFLFFLIYKKINLYL